MKNTHYCPEHGEPEGKPWPCAYSVNGTHPCPHYDQEIRRRVQQIKVDGNYWKILDVGEADVAGHREVTLQEYRHHQPHGEPEPL